MVDRPDVPSLVEAPEREQGRGSYNPDDVQPWTRLEPPFFWALLGDEVIADRHLPDGVRQHLVRGTVQPGKVLANAQILGQADLAHDDCRGLWDDGEVSAVNFVAPQPITMPFLASRTAAPSTSPALGGMDG